MRGSVLLLLVCWACGDATGLDAGTADASGGPDAGPGADAAGADAAEGIDATARGRWVSLAPLARGPRQETAVVELDGEIFVIGGFDARPVMVATVEAYDPATDRWRDVADLPRALHHANAAAIGGKLYVLGSLGAGFTEDGRAYEYDPATNTWREVAAMPAGRARGASAITVLGGRAYVIGGLRRQASVADADTYDPILDAWTPLPALPRVSDHVVAGTIGDRVFVAGGRSGGIAGLSGRLDIFDPGRGEWTQGPDMPTPRGGAMAGVLDGRLYVFGGEGNRAASTGVFAEAQAFDAAAARWLDLAPMTTPRHGTGAAALGGRVYVPGGADVQAFSAVAIHEAFVP